jgi:hypothetical protein
LGKILPFGQKFLELGNFFSRKKLPNDLGEILFEYNWFGDCLGHFCGHWAIFSQKHLVTLTFDKRLTWVERVPTKRPG